jgi:hypothetical protein
MTLSNQSHFPGFFLSPESHLIGFANSGLSSSVVTKSHKMTCRGLANSGLRQAGIGQASVSHLPASPNRGRWLTGAWPVPAYDKPELARPRDLVMPESHLGKPEKMIWWNQLPKVIFQGRVIPACPKTEMIGIFKLTFRGLKNPGKWL